MHSGINTGLVVTGQVDQDGGSTGVLGDTINLASRLSDLAKAGEILVGSLTHQLAEGHFIFERLEPVQFKGKAEAVQVYRLLSTKECISLAARMALIGSSSWALGTPKKATTASPINFWMDPSYLFTIGVIPPKT